MSINKALPPIKTKIVRERVLSTWIVGVGVVLISVFIWQLLLRFERSQANKLLQLRADFVKNELIARFGNRGIVLQGIERRWELGKGITKEVWDADAALFYNHYKGLKATLVTDSLCTLRWIFPPEAGQVVTPSYFHDVKGMDRNLTQTMIRGEVSVLPEVSLYDGSQSIVMSIPLYSNNVLDGFMLAVFDTKEVFDYIFRNIVPGYGVSIYADDRLVYTRQEYSAAYYKKWEKIASFELYQVEWKVVIWPGEKNSPEVNTWLPMWVLMFGILTGVSLMVISHLFQLTKIRARKIDDANRELVYEIVERKLAEDKLKLHQERLDAILQEANAFVCLVDRDGRLMRLSIYAQTLLRVPNEKSVMGKLFKDFLAPDNASWFERNIACVLKEGRNLHEPYDLDVFGRKMRFRFVFFPLTYENGQVYAACCIGIDEKENGLS